MQLDSDTFIVIYFILTSFWLTILDKIRLSKWFSALFELKCPTFAGDMARNIGNSERELAFI